MDNSRPLEQGDWEEDEFDRTVSAFSGSRPGKHAVTGTVPANHAAAQTRQDSRETQQALDPGSGKQGQALDPGPGKQGQAEEVWDQERVDSAGAIEPEEDEFERTVSAFTGSRPGNRAHAAAGNPYNSPSSPRPAATDKGIGARKPLALGWKIAGILVALCLLAAGLLSAGLVGFAAMAVLILFAALCVWGIRKARK